jgi:oligoribonuclease
MTDYLWLDAEMTGLNHKNCRLVEVACFLTKEDLKPYASWEAVIYQNPNVGWEQVAKEMHQKSGLFERIQKEGIDERQAIDELTGFLGAHLQRRQCNLAGNTVHFDRKFIEEQWPSLMTFFTHRILDVSSFKIYAEGLGVKRFDQNAPAHRAMDDIQHSLKEFAYYLAEIKKLP